MEQSMKDQTESFPDEFPLPALFGVYNASEDEGTTGEVTGQESIDFMNGGLDFCTAQLNAISDGQYHMDQSLPTDSFSGTYIEELGDFSTVPNPHVVPGTVPIPADFETHSRDAPNDFIPDSQNHLSLSWEYPQLFSDLPVSNSFLDVNSPSTQGPETSISGLCIEPSAWLQTTTSSGTSSRRQSTENSARDANSLSPSSNSGSCLKGESSSPSSCSTYPGDSSSWSPGSGGSFANLSIGPTAPPKRKRRDTTDGQKRKKNKLRREGVCIACRLRRSGCNSERNGVICDACSSKVLQRFPRCISTKPGLAEKNIFLHSLQSDLRDKVLRLAGSKDRMDVAIKTLCGRLVDLDPALKELQDHKTPKQDGCKPVREQSCLQAVKQGWFGKLYLSNLLVSANAVLRASAYFEYTDKDASDFMTVRAISAAKAFRFLDYAIEKNRLEQMVDTSRKRARDLIVFLAITLEQVLNFEPGKKGDQFCAPSEDDLQGQPPWSEVTACNSLSKNEVERIRTSLAYHLAYFLRFLIEKVFDKDHFPRSGVAESINITVDSITLEDTFWEKFIQLSTALDNKPANAGTSRMKQTAMMSSVGRNQRNAITSPVVPSMFVTRPTFEVLQGLDPRTPIPDESYETPSDENDDAKSIASLRSESVDLTDDDIKSISVILEKDHIEGVHSPATIGPEEVQHGETRNAAPRSFRRGFSKFARGMRNFFTP